MNESGTMNARVTVDIPARRLDQLTNLVTGRDEFIAQMKGLRYASGKCQLEIDQISGLQDGYTGKLEVGIRKNIMQHTFWAWVLALSPGLVIPPKGLPQGANRCPCCGGAVYLRY